MVKFNYDFLVNNLSFKAFIITQRKLKMYYKDK